MLRSRVGTVLALIITAALLSLAPASTKFGNADAAAAARENPVAPPQAGKEFQDCADCPVMVIVPPGSFMMGSPPEEAGRGPDEQPVHKVTINYWLAVGKFELTRAEYEKFANETNRPTANTCQAEDPSGKWVMQSGLSWRNPGFPQTARDPVVCVIYTDAVAYVQWLSAKTGKNYRLLSESEWEYSARGGTQTPWWWGDRADQGCGSANGADLSAKAKFPSWVSVMNCKDGYVYAAPVGSYAANQFGLHDMEGNVWEWVEDCYMKDYTGAPDDGSAWHAGDCDMRDKRGGSFRCVLTCDPATVNPKQAGNIVPGATVRAANRDNDGWGERSGNGGFRIARTY